MRKPRGVTTYSGAHTNTARTRGRAVDQVCGCGQPAKEWALLHGAPGTQVDTAGKSFSIDPHDYVAMCFRCHRVYDKSQITECPKGHPYSDENVIHDAGKRKCKTCVYDRNRRRQRERGLTPDQRRRKNELQRQWRAARRNGATA